MGSLSCIAHVLFTGRLWRDLVRSPNSLHKREPSIVFAVLGADPEYVEKMRKLEEASTISMEVMVYTACPVAFLLGVLSQLVFRRYLDPWKPIRSRIEPGCCPGSWQDCKPKPISRVVQRTVPLQGSNDPSEMPMEEIGQIQAQEIREIPAEEDQEIPGEKNQEIPAEENRENPAEEVEGAGAVAAELGEIFQLIKERRNNR